MHEMASAAEKSIAEGLARAGWVVADAFLDAALVQALARECRALALAPAAVGRASRHRDEAVRGDRTHWLEPGASAAQDALLAQLDALRIALNEHCFLGLAEVEAHFAHYPPGARYVRHRDRFRDDDHRVVSLVCYLNESWDAARDGGALRLYDANGAAHDVAPLGGRAVCFMSADIEHEVLPATRDRLSVAAWLRRR